LEEEHAQSLKKLCRSAAEAVRRPDSRQGSYARNYGEISRIHERMADNGMQFALSLHQMHEDLTELAAEKERGRKEWKQKGLSWEKRVQDAQTAMEKAKSKYNSLAEDYDRARTGDKQTGRFGLKGPKSAAQVEEDLHRKMQVADADYQSKVQTVQALRQELIATLRPQSVAAIEQLIHECDAGLTLQMQKFGKMVDFSESFTNV
jgi:Rho GTPase-activating protein RGD1